MKNDIANYWKPLLKKWKIIIVGSIISAILSFIITSFVPKTYQAKTTILPNESKDTDTRFAGVTIPGAQRQLGPKVSHYLMNLVTSRTVAEYVVSDLNLTEKFGNVGFEKAIGYLMDSVEVKENRYGLVEIIVQTFKPDLAADIANSYVKNLEKFIKENRVTTSKNQRIFIEEQIEKIKPELASAENELKSFKEKNKSLALNEDIKLEIGMIARLKAELVTEENNLKILETYSNETNPEIEKTKRRISFLTKQIEDTENNSSAVSTMPQKELELTRLVRNFSIKEKIYMELVSQYESTKVSEAKENKLFTFLDKAVPPERHSSPSRMKNTIFVAIGWFIISLSVIIFKIELTS